MATANRFNLTDRGAIATGGGKGIGNIYSQEFARAGAKIVAADIDAAAAGRAISRPQVPEDLVGAIMFLSSAASDFMTGQTVNVGGGKSMH